jgi:hypothetical protein
MRQRFQHGAMLGSSLLSAATVGRRSALAALGGLALAPAASAASSRRRVDWADPADNLAAFGRLWASLDQPVIGAFHGLMYARIPGRRLIPLFNYEGTGVIQARLEPDGRLAIKSRETGFFTALGSREVLEWWDNPLTGERVEVYHFYNDVLGGRIGRTIPTFVMAGGGRTRMNEGTSFPGPDGTAPFRLPIDFAGERAMVSWDYAHEYPNPVTPEGWPRASTGRVITPSEHFTFTAPRALLEDPDVPSVPFSAGFTRVSEAWPFMRMGSTPLAGLTLFGRMFSHKGLKGVEEVQPRLLAYIERHAPDYLTLPDGWPVGNARIDTWSAYAMDVPPERPGHGWAWLGRERPVAAPPRTGLGARSWR